VIKGLAFAGRDGIRREIITSPTEHSAVIEPCGGLSSSGFASRSCGGPLRPGRPGRSRGPDRPGDSPSSPSWWRTTRPGRSSPSGNWCG
jgi:hypothetical protein